MVQGSWEEFLIVGISFLNNFG
ncbi:hypothetical protein Nmel_017904 [Mimus melanotis]